METKGSGSSVAENTDSCEALIWPLETQSSAGAMPALEHGAIFLAPQ